MQVNRAVYQPWRLHRDIMDFVDMLEAIARTYYFASSSWREGAQKAVENPPVGVFINGSTPIAGWFVRKKSIKIRIMVWMGCLCFGKPPYDDSPIYWFFHMRDETFASLDYIEMIENRTRKINAWEKRTRSRNGFLGRDLELLSVSTPPAGRFLVASPARMAPTAPGESIGKNGKMIILLWTVTEKCWTKSWAAEVVANFAVEFWVIRVRC